MPKTNPTCREAALSATAKLGDGSKLAKWTMPLPAIEWGKVIRVVDGDTLHVAFPVAPEGNVVRFVIRLAGLNCPEISNKASVSAEERSVGIEAKFIMQQRWLGKLVRVRAMPGYEKWGRLLAELEDEEGCCINDWLLEQHWAVPYDGKRNFKTDWLKYRQGYA